MKKYITRAYIGGLKLYLNGLSYMAPIKAGEDALKLFAKPRKGKITPEQNEFLAPAEKLFYKLGSEVIPVYRFSGGENTILLAHGWESNSARWEPLLPYLQKLNLTVYTLDAPAHGASKEKYFSAVEYGKHVAEALKNIQPDYVLGHSAGGYAVVYAVGNNVFASLKKIILLAPSSDNRFFFHKFLDFFNFDARFKALFFQNLTNKLGDLNHLTSYTFAPNIQTPTFIIHDEDDDIVPIAQSIAFDKSLPKSHLLITSGIGHRLRDDSIYQEIVKLLAQ